MGDGFSRGPYRPNLFKVGRPVQRSDMINKCANEGCLNLRLETKDHCASCIHKQARLQGVTGLAGQEVIMLGACIEGVRKSLDIIETNLRELATKLGLGHLLPVIEQIGQKPPPGLFFLNEAHELPRTTKSQLRKERRDAKRKAEAEGKNQGKGSVGTRPARKSRSRRSVRR